MNNNVSGMIRAIRYLRSSLSIVALVFILIAVLIVTILLSPVLEILKYILIGVFIILGVGVWVCFWKKAKTEPLTVSEEYWIAALPYSYGTDKEERLRKDELELPKLIGGQLLIDSPKKEKVSKDNKSTR